MAINFKFLKRKCDGSLDESSESKIQLKSSDTDPGLSQQSSFQTFKRQRDNPEHDVSSANNQWLATSTLNASDNVYNSYQGLPENMKQLPDVCKEESETDKPYQCYVCNITFESANSFLEHSNAVHKPDRQKEEANIAQSIVTDANTLVMGGTLHTCRDCNILFSDYDTLLSHIKQQHQSSEDGVSAKPTTTVKRHQCYVCGKTFPKPLQVQQHLKSSHPEENVAEPKKKLEGVQCPYCPKYFAKTLFLKYHVRDKHNEFYNYWLEQQGLELTHKCKICKDVRVFKTLDYLKDHIRMSHKEEYEANEKAKETEPFLFGQMCLICSECFIDTPALQEHADVHKDDSGLFPCSIHCEEKFEKYFQVMNHYVRHRLRSFGCLRCAAKFVRFRQWVAHNAKHHGYSLGQFTCAVCEKDFPIKLALETHMKTMHKENVRCPNCGAYFTDQHMVEKHVAKKHSVQELA